jgi:hypothetical protein
LRIEGRIVGILMVDENIVESKLDLELQPLDQYAQQVRDTFHVEELEEIAFHDIERLPTEIERRRALLRYFIPDIFQPGRYDRRADLIDACIYYLENPRNRRTILRLWAQRAKFNWRDLHPQDIEQCPYGYAEYHPTNFTIGSTTAPSPFLPKLIQYLRCFKDRKLKLDINDYTTVYFSVYAPDPPSTLTPLLLQFLRCVEEALIVPGWEGLNLKKFMTERGFKENTHLLATLRRSWVRLFSLLERSVFGLGHLILEFPFPYHYRIYYKNHAMTQNFLTGGGEYLQEITFSFPTDADWHALVRPLHPETRILRQTFFRRPYSPTLHLFDEASQRWQIPWERVTQEWRACLEENVNNTSPLEVGYDAFIPKPAELIIAAILEADSFLTNAEIAATTSLPIEEVQRIRQFLEEEMVAQRLLYVKFGDFTDFCYIDLPGIDMGKFNILTRIGSVFPTFSLMQLENLKTGEKLLRGLYFHEPPQIYRFLTVLNELFDGVLPYTIYTAIRKIRLALPFHQYYKFDSGTGTWRAEGEFRFQPIWRKEK